MAYTYYNFEDLDFRIILNVGTFFGFRGWLSIKNKYFDLPVRILSFHSIKINKNRKL